MEELKRYRSGYSRMYYIVDPKDIEVLRKHGIRTFKKNGCFLVAIAYSDKYCELRDQKVIWLTFPVDN